MTDDSAFQKRLIQSLNYDPEKGEFWWLHKKPNRSMDKPAGCVTGLGYRRIKLDGVGYLAHRLAWMYVYGRWPDRVIDHINGDRADNRLCNLREASHAENSRNRGRSANNSSGYKGVYWNKNERKWHAQIGYERRLRHIGFFKCKHEAYAAYCDAARRLHGEFAFVEDENLAKQENANGHLSSTQRTAQQVRL